MGSTGFGEKQNTRNVSACGILFSQRKIFTEFDGRHWQGETKRDKKKKCGGGEGGGVSVSG